jgi:hypothetical protein
MTDSRRGIKTVQSVLHYSMKPNPRIRPVSEQAISED